MSTEILFYLYRICTHNSDGMGSIPVFDIDITCSQSVYSFNISTIGRHGVH
jgi:hypothetical protein